MTGHDEQSVRLIEVTMKLCSLCLAGAGGECHTPGCALWMNRAPDVSLLLQPTVMVGPSWPAYPRELTS